MAGGIQLLADMPRELPPRDAWRYNPTTLQRFQALTDDRGFVLPEATIETLLGFFDDTYQWPVDWSKDAAKIMRPDVHHLYWPRAWYAKPAHRGSNTPRDFRELPVHRGILPRQFHNVWHLLVLPPDMPNRGRMEHRLNSFAIARQLFETAERAIVLESMLQLPSEEEQLRRYYIRYSEVVNAFQKRRRQAIGMRALREVGVTETDLLTPRDAQLELGRFGVISSGKVPNYTHIYFEENAA